MEFEVIHRAGFKHQAADAPSRLETTGDDDRMLDENLPVVTTHTDTESESDDILSTEQQSNHPTAQWITGHDKTVVQVVEEGAQHGEEALSSRNLV